MALKTRTMVAMISLAATATLSSLGITAAYPAAPDATPTVIQYAPEYDPYGQQATSEHAALIAQTPSVGADLGEPSLGATGLGTEIGGEGERVFVSLTVDGLTRYFYTGSTTVAGVLFERGVQLAATDRLNVDLNATVSDAMSIVVQRVAVVSEEHIDEIGWSSSNHYTTDLAPGAKRVAVAGVSGSSRVVTLTVWVDGVIESQQDTVEVLAEAINEVVEVGVGSGGDAQIIAFNMMRERGWGDDQFTCIVDLWTRESHWNPTAENPDSGAYGIPQALPASKMSTHGDDWAWNPATQIAWGLDYVANRYGSPCGAWSFWLRNYWY